MSVSAARPVVGRFAPSPSGYLHLGNLLAMLLAWLDCRSLGGEMVFRMEDLDVQRSRPEYIAALVDERASTWNTGYDEKYLRDQGCLYRAISRRWWKLLCLQDAVRRSKSYKRPVTEAYKLIVSGK